MKITKQARREAKHLLRSCIVDGVLDDNRVRQVVDQVLSARPRGYLAVLAHFQRLLHLELERRRARVESAVALSAPAQAQVRASLERRYGRGLEFEFSENPTLLGGMRVQVGSDVYDGTVRNRLNQLREAFESA
jgi:F-type H+-transporting ATPase subunit delta